MNLFHSAPGLIARLLLTLGLLFGLLAVVPAASQEIILGVTYVCNGDRVVVEGCDIR